MRDTVRTASNTFYAMSKEIQNALSTVFNRVGNAARAALGMQHLPRRAQYAPRPALQHAPQLRASHAPCL